MKLLTDEYIGAERFGIPLGEILAETGDVFDFRTHTHSYYEMTLYRPFNGGVFINNGFVPIASTTAILISPSDFHSIKVTGQASGYIKLSFDNTVIGGQNTQISSVIVPNLDENGFMAAAFREALKFRGDKSYLKALINTMVYRLLADGERVVPSSEGHGLRIVAEAVGIINEGFCGNISLPSVAKQLSVTPQYLSRIFKDALGVGFSKYLSDMRLRRAERMLAETELSVTEICLECGYGNLSHFLRVFKSAHNATPTEYRHMKK